MAKDRYYLYPSVKIYIALYCSKQKQKLYRLQQKNKVEVYIKKLYLLIRLLLMQTFKRQGEHPELYLKNRQLEKECSIYKCFLKFASFFDISRTYPLISRTPKKICKKALFSEPSILLIIDSRVERFLEILLLILSNYRLNH